ncbi:MAG: hypothetical protein ABJA78_20050 [Ferruginibacter sp.]
MSFYMKQHRIAKYIAVISLLILAGCQSKTNNPALQQIKDSGTAQKEIKSNPVVVDSGQVFFEVTIIKNDTPYMHYQGAWPLLLSSNNSSTIQLSESKNLMSITNMLTIYMHGLPTGNVPVVLSNRDTNTASMIMSEVVNGNYDIPIMPSEGSLQITKNTGKILSGSFQAKAIDANKNIFLLSGTFLNVGVNDDKNIK